MRSKKIKERLEYLRGEIEAERISYFEIAELESLAGHIDPDDVLLLEWAGVPEFAEDYDTNIVARKRRKVKKNSGIPSREEYENYEHRLFLKQLQEVEDLPLSERRENRIEYVNDLTNNPEIIIDRIGWIINGTYGFGPYNAFKKLSKRMNRRAWLFIVLAAIEWGVSNEFSRGVWNDLPKELQNKINAGIDEEIKYGIDEGYLNFLRSLICVMLVKILK